MSFQNKPAKKRKTDSLDKKIKSNDKIIDIGRAIPSFVRGPN